MAIYSDSDFKNDDKLIFKPLLKEPGPASQDLHIAKVFNQNVPENMNTTSGYLEYLKEMEKMDIDEKWVKFRRHLKEAPVYGNGKDSGWIIKPGVCYLAETAEKVTLPRGLGLDVDTRSSWARFGIRVQHVDDELEYLGGYEGRIPLMITACDVPVLLREKDRICQAVVYEGDKGLLSNSEIYDEICGGQIECYIPAPHDPKKKMPNFKIKNHSIQLTLHPTIKKFQDSLIDPKKDQSKKYVDIELSGGKQVPYRKFFLGSSNEVVGIGDEYVGLLRELFTSPERVRTHSNAGYFDPGFEGNATLEQYIVEGGPNILYPDMKMGELEICSLKTPCRKRYKSKYSGQCGATPSKAHMDF